MAGVLNGVTGGGGGSESGGPLGLNLGGGGSSSGGGGSSDGGSAPLNLSNVVGGGKEASAGGKSEDPKEIEEDRKLAQKLAKVIQDSINKIHPILKLITQAIDKAEAQPEQERDEEKLVETVKPLLEEGGGILQECNGAVRALDPDGRIQANAQHKTASRDATPEEQELADRLKDLTGGVMKTIDAAKKKVSNMPHAKKELNPLWGLLAEPLGQIVAAVGLLLSGVLGLVGRLLNGLGLGGLLDNLLGGLGLTGLLDGLGLGGVTNSLLGKK